MAVWPKVTCPSPASATRPPRRTPRIVVARNSGCCIAPPKVASAGVFQTRMGRVIDAPELLVRQVGVDLRRRETGVAEQLLDGAQVRAALQHVGGEAVPQRV